MRAVVQRVAWARVTVANTVVGEIERGLLLLLGAGSGDTATDVDYMCQKIANLRLFEDSDGKMNLSLLDQGGSLLVVSQFTLYGDCRKGRRPSFAHAMAPDEAELTYRSFVERCREAGIKTECGIFGAKMSVELLNDGPVTLLVDSRKSF